MWNIFEGKLQGELKITIIIYFLLSLPDPGTVKVHVAFISSFTSYNKRVNFYPLCWIISSLALYILYDTVTLRHAIQ